MLWSREVVEPYRPLDRRKLAAVRQPRRQRPEEQVSRLSYPLTSPGAEAEEPEAEEPEAEEPEAAEAEAEAAVAEAAVAEAAEALEF